MRRKQTAVTAALPVIFITARTDADSETLALASGAVDFIHKPINPLDSTPGEGTTVRVTVPLRS